jgi:hypothetical protein
MISVEISVKQYTRFLCQKLKDIFVGKDITTVLETQNSTINLISNFLVIFLQYVQKLEKMFCWSYLVYGP